MKRKINDQQGAILILTAFIVSILLGFCCLIIDGYRMYQTYQNLQTALQYKAESIMRRNIEIKNKIVENSNNITDNNFIHSRQSLLKNTTIIVGGSKNLQLKDSTPTVNCTGVRYDVTINNNAFIFGPFLNLANDNIGFTINVVSCYDKTLEKAGLFPYFFVSKDETK